MELKMTIIKKLKGVLGKVASRDVSRKALILNTLAILAVINFLTSFLPFKIDATKNREFTLSKTTRETIKALDDIVTIKVYLSKNLPVGLIPVKMRIRDTLAEYEKISPGKVKIVYIDPQNDMQLINQAVNLGIPQLRFSDVQNDRFSVSTGFLGMAVLFGDKKEVIEAVRDDSNLEHDLTSAIQKVSRKTTARVGLSTGHGETDDARVNLLKTLLEKEFEVAAASLSEKNDEKMIGGDIKTLLMINPREKFGPRALFILDQFLMKGGSLVLLLDPIEISNNLQPSLNETNIGQFLGNYGLKVNTDLILSADNEIANFSTGYNAFITPYPFWVRILPQGFDKSLPATAELETAVLPWVSSLSVDPSKTAAKIIETVRTSPRSFSQNGSINVDPGREQNPQPEELKQFAVAALLRGKTASAVKSLPDLKKATGAGEKVLEESEVETNIALFADSDFVGDYFIGRYPGNAALLLNTIETVTADSGLSEIRSKGSNFKPLKELSETARTLIKWSNIIVVPLLIIVLGTVRFLLRSR